MRENVIKAGLKIVAASVCLIIYYLLIVYPYWERNASIATAWGIWKDTGAQAVYALLFYPAFAWYLHLVARNILSVRYIRMLVYPFCFLVVFAGFHGVFMIRDLPVVAGIATVTLPVGIIGLIIVFFWGLKLDIKQKFLSEKSLEENFENHKQLFDVLTGIVIPCLLVFFAVYSIRTDARMNKQIAALKSGMPPLLSPETQTDVPAVRKKIVPSPNTRGKEFRGLSFSNGCDYFTGVMREASGQVETGKKDSLEQIAKAYETEFKKENVYGKIELKEINPDYAEFHLWQKGVVWLIFRFEKKGDCLPDGKNCFFSLLHGKDPCMQYIGAKTKK